MVFPVSLRSLEFPCVDTTDVIAHYAGALFPCDMNADGKDMGFYIIVSKIEGEI